MNKCCFGLISTWRDEDLDEKRLKLYKCMIRSQAMNYVHNLSKETSSEENLQVQEESLESRIKIQDSRHDIISMFNYMAIAALVG